MIDTPQHSPSPPPAARRVRYFLRDDDIGELTDALRAFVETFVSRKLPVSYQIIPARLTEDCAAYLLEVERNHPELIEFGQHGLRHEMTLRGKRLKREFGPERSLDQQQADIAEGQRILADRLGRRLVLFTPPQHKFDRNTVTAAAAAGHKVFSAACYATPHHRLAYGLGRRLGLSSIAHHGISYHGGVRPEAPLAEISISIAVDNGRRITTGADALPAAIAEAEAGSDLVGLMFHHAVYAGPEGRAALDALAVCLSRYPAQDFHRLGDLADGQA